MSSFCQKSIPFWSPRYSAYMCTDPSLPALLGYITAMFFNSNNVSTDVSPLTTAVERHAGLQLCEMLGFNMSHVSNDNGPWGHITSGGSIANLESMWYVHRLGARNLKFYPLALRMAIDSPLSFLQAKFKVTLCDGMTLKAMSACTPWELVNLAPDTISGLSKRLEAEHGISPVYLSNVLKRYLVQRIGRNEIEHYFGLSAGKYFVASSKHYSWPKCAALTGIGSDNVVNIAVDKIARLDINALDRQLQLCLVNQTPIYAVVAIIGSTIHGAVDPLADIIALRRKYQRKGLSFIIHADAAWGGYFAAMLREPPTSENYIAEETALSSYSETQLYNLRFCDSVTVDPHKMGYAPYPAGALCYRDGRMRLFVSWKPAEVSDGESSMGVYGVEGRQPGAASVSVWASHKVIGLHMSGYGSIMARALLSAVQFYCHWATMTTADSVLIVVPLHELPFEHGPLSSSLALQTQKQHIQSTLLFRSPEELSQDPVTMRLVKHLGSDLSINTFSINFRVDGVTNDSTVEANYLARRISDRLRKGGPSSADVPLFLRDIQMAADLYGVCAAHMKERLGLPTSAEDLHVLTNVVMSPFITSEDLSHSIAGFRRLAEQEIQACIFRNKAVPETLHFAVQGRARDNHLHLILLPMFHLAGLRHQLILEVTVPPDVAQRYNYTLSIFSPDQIFTLSTANEEMIEEILDRRTFNAVLNQELPGPHLRQVESAFRIIDVRVVVHRSLHDRAWAPAYPQHMPFLLYGTPQDVHLMHVLVRAPNFHLSAQSVGVYVEDGALSAADLAHGMLAVAKHILEAPIQP
ncbi:PLP-dependent transferase, partial [Fistulina hepatica ATCC 64428]